MGMKRETQQTGEYLIGLLKAVLHDTQPLEKPEQISFEQLYRMAKFHYVRSMVYYAIEKLSVQPEPERNKKWKKVRDLQIVNSFVQLSERDTIVEKLTDCGIDVLPLKGCLLKEMYPQVDYREMADLDILIDAKKAKLAGKQMKLLGYRTEHFAVSNHDNYAKPPYMCVELHREMIAERFKTHGYYKNVWEKAIPSADGKHCFHLSWDDYYVFMLVHFAKHYFGEGSGIRSIMDIYVFLKHHRADLHQDYLQKELESLDLYEFKQTAEALAEVWFEDGKATEKTQEMAEYVITSGVYGTRQRRVENGLKEAEEKTNSVWKGKIAYFFSRVFLPYSTMRGMFPFLNKLPILLPFCWVARLIMAPIQKRERVKAELNLLKQHNKPEPPAK